MAVKDDQQEYLLFFVLGFKGEKKYERTGRLIAMEREMARLMIGVSK